MYYHIDFLNHISNIIMLKSSTIDDTSLFSGKMGISVFFMHYSKFIKNSIYSDFANELIDDIYEDINQNTPIDFENGLAGIGWGFLHLIDHGFIEGTPTLILEEIDNKIYSILKKYEENAINPYIYPYIKYRITFPTPIYIYYTYHTYINKNNHLYSRHHLSLLDLIKTNNLSTHISDSNNIGLSGLSGIVLKQIITPYNIPTMKDPTGRNNKLLVNLNTLTL